MTNIIVNAGQVLTGVTVGAGDSLTVNNGGTVIAATVTAGGSLTVNGGGIAVDASVDAASSGIAGLTVEPGGIVSGATISAAATGDDAEVTILPQGTATATTVGSYGSGSAILMLDAGATESGTLIVGDGEELITIGADQVSEDTVIPPLVQIDVAPGGTISPGTQIDGGVLTGAGFSGLIVEDGTVAVTANGAIDSTMLEGGTVTLSDGDVATATLLTGGTLAVGNGSIANGTTVSAGVVQMLGGITNDTIVSDSGTLVVGAGSIANTPTLASGGVVDVAATGTINATTLGPGGTIDLAGIPYGLDLAARLAAASDVLAIGGASGSATLQMAGSYVGDAFAATSDGGGGVVVMALPSDIALHGASLQYVIADDAGALYLQDTVNGRDGTQTVSGVSEIKFTDGVGVFDPSGSAEAVARLYTAVLGRAPDVAGLAYWAAQMDAAQVPLSSVASGFAAAPEFIHTYGAPSDAAFVELLYQHVLGRAADAAGAQYWTGALAGGLSRGAVAQTFAGSAEYVADTMSMAGDVTSAEAYRLYAAALDRAPDAAGLAYWSGQLAGGAASSQVAQAFIGSAEFQADYGTLSTGDFVATLYENVLHRAPDAAGAQYWTGQLQAGASAAGVLLGFANSLENRIQTAAATHANWVFIPN